MIAPRHLAVPLLATLCALFVPAAPAAVGPGSTPAPAAIPPADFAPLAATVLRGGEALTPANNHGVFDRIILRPRERVAVTLRGPGLAPGESVFAYTLHGGWIDGERTRHLRADTNGEINLVVETGAFYGNYPIVIRTRGSEQVLTFWVQDENDRLPGAAPQDDDGAPGCGNPPQPDPDPCEGLSGAELCACCEENPDACGGGGGSGGGSGGGGSGPTTASTGCGGAAPANGMNPFNPSSGTVSREITDLAMTHLAGQFPMGIARTHISRPDELPSVLRDLPFGDGGHWRHSFQWTMGLVGKNSISNDVLRVIYPDGRLGNFERKNRNDPYLIFEPSTHERMEVNGTNYSLLMLDGTRHQFEETTQNSQRLFRAVRTIDRYNNVYQFHYASNALQRVVAPNTNQWIHFDYGTLPGSVRPGFVRFTYTNHQAVAVALSGSFNGWALTAMGRGPGGVWTMEWPLGNGVHEYKFVVSDGSTTRWVGDDENPYWTAPDTNAVVLVDPFPVITRIRSSDGRSVDYRYAVLPGDRTVHVALTNVVYGDGTDARYTYYSYTNETRTCLLKTADDPMYRGPGRSIEYLYQTNRLYAGQIMEERSLDTGVLYARLDISLENPRLRVVTRANGEKHSIAYTGNSGGRPHTFTNPVGRVHHKTYYGGNGMTASRTDDLGRTTTYQRTPLFGAVTVASNSVNGVVRYTYTDVNRPFHLASITDEQGRVTRHTRDANHRVTRTDYPDGTFETFTYAANGALTAQQFRDGTTESYQYNAKGLRTATTRASGLVETFSYDAHDRLAVRSNSLGQVWTTTYTWRGLPLVQRHPDGTTDQHSYNRYGQVTQTINRIGARTVFTYDTYGHLASTRDALGHTLTVSNNLLGLPVQTTLPSGLTVRRTYDGLDRVLSETWLSDTTAVRKSYGPLGLTSQVSRAGAVRAMTRDLDGRVIAERDPLGRVTTFAYDTDGNRITVTNPDGGILRYRYDLNNRPVSATDCQGHTTSNVYDQAGRLVRQISATGIVTSNRYDTAGRLVSRHQGGLLLASNRYNEAGWVVWSRNEDGIAVTNTYDLAGRLVRATLPDGTYTEQVYSNGLLVATYDRARRVTRYQHNALGRVTNQIDNAGHAVAYTYNAAGNLTELRDQNGQRTRFVFDAEGRQTMKIYDDGTVHTYAYDAEGRLVARTDALGRTTHYRYDLAGNLLEVDYPTDADVAFAYDALNRRIRMVDGIGTSVYAYAEGCTAMTGEDGPFSQNDTLAYTYDADKRLTGVALGTTAWTYTPDALGRIAAIGSAEGAYTYTYAASGRRPLQLTRPNGVHTHVAYDALMMATSLLHRTVDGVILDGRDYRYDAAGQRSWERRNGEEIDYGYDPIGQVVSAQSRWAGYDFSYAYDPAGNPVRQSKNGFVMSNAFNRLNQLLTGTWSGSATVLGEVDATGATVRVNNRIATLLPAGRYAATGIPLVGGTNLLAAVVTDAAGRSATSRVEVVARNKAYGHDLNGNMTNDADKVYAWDEENRLVRVTERGTGKLLLQNRYDGLSRRRERIMLEADGRYSTNRYVYQGWLVKAVLNARNEIHETYTHGPDLSGSLEGAGGIGGILAERINGTTRWYHPDLMGNITLLTTTSRTPATRITYDPFGHVLEQKGPPPRYQFSSKEYDATVGLNYYGYRFYFTGSGRWLSLDPIGMNGGLNLFAFIDNNPLRKVDYYGLKACCPAEKKEADEAESACIGLAESSREERDKNIIENKKKELDINEDIYTKAKSACESMRPPMEAECLHWTDGSGYDYHACMYGVDYVVSMCNAAAFVAYSTANAGVILAAAYQLELSNDRYMLDVDTCKKNNPCR